MGLRLNPSSPSVRRLATSFVASLATVTLLSTTLISGDASLAGATSGAPRCTTGDLVVWLNTTGNGAAGSSYYNLEFTNVSAHACSVSGYPGVSAVNVAGTQIGSAAGHNAEHPATLITLSSATAGGGLGGFVTHNTATVILQITDAGNYSNSTCGRVVSAGLRVYPPDQTASRIIPYPFVTCAKHGPLILHVEPIQKGVVTG
ncbi:MAG: DUF4232 domain-containing protein [Acidimicrobiales bacterium]